MVIANGRHIYGFSFFSFAQCPCILLYIRKLFNSSLIPRKVGERPVGDVGLCGEARGLVTEAEEAGGGQTALSGLSPRPASPLPSWESCKLKGLKLFTVSICKWMWLIFSENIWNENCKDLWKVWKFCFLKCPCKFTLPQRFVEAVTEVETWMKCPRATMP